MYTAEALCALGRVEEAVALLQPQLTTESSTGPGSHDSLLSMKNVPNQWFLNSHCLLRHTTGPVGTATSNTTGNVIHEQKKRIHDMIVAVNNAAAISMSGGSGSQQLAKAQLLLDPVMKANPGKNSFISYSHVYHIFHYDMPYPIHAHVLSFHSHYILMSTIYLSPNTISFSLPRRSHVQFSLPYITQDLYQLCVSWCIFYSVVVKLQMLWHCCEIVNNHNTSHLVLLL